MQMKLLRGIAAGAALALGAAVVAPSVASAQDTGLKFGVAASYGDDVDFGVGVFGMFHLMDMSGRAIGGRIGFDYYFPGDGYGGGFGDSGVNVHYWEINGDALYNLTVEGSSLRPYVGAGIRYGHTSFSFDGDDDFCDIAGADCGGSDVGLNLIGGLNLGSSKLAPFVEFKLNVGDGPNFAIKGGIHF